MTPDLLDVQDLNVENALLRSCLWFTVQALQNYQDAKHSKIDDEGRTLLVVTVPESLHVKAAEALAKADMMLKNQGRSRG